MDKEICCRCKGSGLIEVGLKKPTRVGCPICKGRGVIPIEKGKIIKIVELTASIDKDGGVWGYDTNLGRIDKLVAEIQKILKGEVAG